MIPWLYIAFYVGLLLFAGNLAGKDDASTIRYRISKGDGRSLDHTKLWEWRAVLVLVFSILGGFVCLHGSMISGFLVMGYGLFTPRHRNALNKAMGRSPFYIAPGNKYDEAFLKWHDVPLIKGSAEFFAMYKRLPDVFKNVHAAGRGQYLLEGFSFALALAANVFILLHR